MQEDKSFEKFVAICYVLGFISLLCLGYVWAFGIPNFSNLDEQRAFCSQWGGFPIEPSRETYNEMICIFDYEDTYVEYVASKVTNQEWKEALNYEYNYCFSCWDSRSCSSSHNDILREKGVHC